MNLNDLFTEEKVRLDPKCWTGKKIGNPKTKMKGGVRVNNCVPAESVNEMDKSQTPPGRDGGDSDASKKEYTAKATTAKKVAKDGEKILNKELNKKQGVAEGYQLDEGAIETITALVKKIPGIGKYYQMAQQYKPQLIEILKTSKSGKEVKQKMEQLAAGQSATVAESGTMKQLGGLAVGGGSILSTMWMNAMGMIDGVLAHAAAGEVGGAVASGSILGLIPVTLMLFAAMLMFKGSNQSSDEKAQAFQAQRGQKGVAEGELDEGWKSALGAAAIAGTMAMGGGAHARVSGDYVDNSEINRLTGQPKVTQQISPDAAKPAAAKPGFSKEYLQSVVDGTHPRPLISKERAQELLQQQTTNEQSKQQKGADYRDPPEADYGDDYQDMVARVKKLAGLGPLKTVYDPAKRVYRNMPTAVKPKN